MAAISPDRPTVRQKNVFVLCFDGTGNKFSGTDADSNILKLYRMLDRTDANVYTFYQPGIGTYITSHSMQTTTMAGRIRSWYMKAKDSAVGSSFAEHVMGGYQFLMRYYSCEDDLYFFGFSRGAYTARFLAEMLDHIGLLSAGNEELVRFAWKTYAKWASRKSDGSKASQKEEADLYEFMRGFRETFARPVRRIRFLGLFDTVNSVPKFESAWMQRSKFPYTARSSAKVIRHAVSIDERRAKFRQDLISGDQPQQEDRTNPKLHRYNSDLPTMKSSPRPGTGSRNYRNGNRMPTTTEESETFEDQTNPFSLDEKLYRNRSYQANNLASKRSQDSLTSPTDPDSDYLKAIHRNRFADARNNVNQNAEDPDKQEVRAKRTIHISNPHRAKRWKRRQYSQIHKAQDIEEVWFAGGHADIGGGWTRNAGEKWMLSHAPLVWMVNEAEKAGLEFDPLKMANHACHGDKVDEYGERASCPDASQRYYDAFKDSYTRGVTHDCLSKGNGLAYGAVMLWKFMEYLPFRRMDLQPDGSWKAIRWPLPMGETRDIPLNAQIHHSVLKRIDCKRDYRPGNLIIGGGGRGVRHAKEKYKDDDWEVYKFPGDPILETWRRRNIYPQE